MKQKTNKILSLLTFVLFSLSGLQIDAQQSKYDEEISDELLKLGQEKLELIKDDLADGKTGEWAGIYHSNSGTTVSTILGWSENFGFFTSWFNCSRPWTERINYGSAEFSNNRLKINPTLAKDEKSSHIIADEYVAVKWDEQHFLIPPKELLNFVYAVHANSELQIEVFFLKTGDREKSRKGFPNVPQEFEKFLTMKTVKPKISAVKKFDKNDIWDDEIILDSGRADNIIEKMIFYNSDSSGDIRLIITDVRENTSKAMIIAAVNGSKIKAGMRFTSKRPENFTEY